MKVGFSQNYKRTYNIYVDNGELKYTIINPNIKDIIHKDGKIEIHMNESRLIYSTNPIVIGIEEFDVTNTPLQNTNKTVEDYIAVLKDMYKLI